MIERLAPEPQSRRAGEHSGSIPRIDDADIIREDSIASCGERGRQRRFSYPRRTSESYGSPIHTDGTCMQRDKPTLMPHDGLNGSHYNGTGIRRIGPFSRLNYDLT